MDLKSLLVGETADVKVEWEGEQVSVTYWKNAYTPKLEAEVMAAGDQGGGTALADLLDKLISGWDITDGGEAFQPTRENIGTLPVTFLVQVMKAVSEHMASDPTLSGTSDAHS